ncbi:sulfotransferase domain-containing protein [uncultured Eudoraea sp.]|uniref:sulfotransferase domain-containing protein n=1 Tax=uncultured Eudoraea sp. TaxID=1035614 RepID=UPI00261EB16C|nr:sulfotransferase domain-containing protein [uncultured Eudoraea sp.]
MKTIKWPVKKQELQSNHFDSTMWNDFKFRDDDIVISTYAKSGTTWVQQIVSQLIFNGETGLPVAEMSPWVDLRVPPKHVKLPAIEAQNHRRFLKTHLPVENLNFSPKAKYIYIGRDGRDVIWSMYHHHLNANDKFYEALNESPGLVGPKIERPGDSVVEYYHEWLDKDGYPIWSLWDNVNSWWAIKDLPNVLMLHFNNLKKDMPGEIRKIAAFLDIPIDESKWNDILTHCSFEYMKENAAESAPLGGAFWEGGAKTFINKGTNGRWKDLLSEEEAAKYDKIASEKLLPECARWLKTGEY